MKIYIASPYTNGDQAANVRAQIDAFRLLIKAGHIPFAPLLSHFIDIVYQMDYQHWIRYDLAWLESCDCVLRMPGDSPGADIEVKHAEKLNIPIYYSITELC